MVSHSVEFPESPTLWRPWLTPRHPYTRRLLLGVRDLNIISRRHLEPLEAIHRRPRGILILKFNKGKPRLAGYQTCLGQDQGISTYGTW
jgi:hypothetical protein